MASLSSQHHSFDIALAAEFGVECAILIHHFQHWIRINQQAKRNIREGRCWTYQSRREILLHFPYWNFDEIRRLCEKLVKLGVLISKNFNKTPIDKTLWYAFVDEKAFKVDADFSRNVYERQNCPSKGKIALRKAKLPNVYKEQILKTTDTKTTDIKANNTPPNPQTGEEPGGSGEWVAFGDFVRLRKEELQGLLRVYEEAFVMGLIDEINDHLASTGNKPYNNYAATLRNWIRRRKKLEPISNPTKDKNPLSSIHQENWNANYELVKEVIRKNPRQSAGLNFYYLKHILKDDNDPNFSLSGLMNPRDFCGQLGKHIKLHIFAAKYPGETYGSQRNE